MSCKPREPGWHQDPAQLQEEYDHHKSFPAVALVHGGSASLYSKWWRKNGLEKLAPGSKPSSPDIEEVTLDAERLNDVHAELRSRGLDPAEWVIVRIVVNTWDSVSDGEPLPLKQLKITLRPRIDLLLAPAAPLVSLKPIRPAKPDKSKPRLVVFVGDEQAPYHDLTLHALFCRWLAHNRPHEAVHLGDLMDLPTLSRHRPNPVWNASPQQCIQAGFDILHAYRVSSPDTHWQALPGNHDERIRDYQLQRAPEMFGVRPADLDDKERAALHSLPSLLHLDKLGVEWHGSDGDYEHAQVDLAPELVARHGFITGQNSAEKTVRKLGLSVVVGHTHRQVVTYVTEERRRESLTMLGVEAGCMCRIEGGLGYVVNPNWTNGFATAQIWPDGRFTVDLGVYRNGSLTWRDQRYSLEERKAA